MPPIRQLNDQLSPERGGFEAVSEGTKAFGFGAAPSASQIALARDAIRNAQGMLAQLPSMLDYCTPQAVGFIGLLQRAADGADNAAQLVNAGSSAAQQSAALRGSIDAGVANPYDSSIGCKQQGQWSDGSWHDCLNPGWLHRVQQCVGAAAQAVASAQPAAQPKTQPRSVIGRMPRSVSPIVTGRPSVVAMNHPARFGLGVVAQSHAVMRANARAAIEHYLSARPNAKAAHGLFASGQARRSRYAGSSMSFPRTGLGDVPTNICPGTGLTSEYQASIATIVSNAPTGLPLGGTVLDASLVQQSACEGAQQLVSNTSLGFSITKQQMQTAIGVTVDAQNVASAMGDILHQISQNGFDWQTAATIATDASAAVGSIVAILVAVSAVTAGTGLVISAAVGLAAFAVSVLGPLLSKPSPCAGKAWIDPRSGNTYPGRIERICVSGTIVSSPTDHNWRAFPNSSDILFGFGGWFDLPHDKINLKDRQASWKGLTIASDDDAAYNWRPIDLAFGDYRRLECEASSSTHPWVEAQSWSAEQKTAVYAFMAYFFEMWKKTAESRLNGLPSDWRNMLASALLHWNMAHEPGSQGAMKIYAAQGAPSQYPQQGDCGSIVNSSTPPLFLMLASDAYASGTSINDLDPGGSSGFFSGQDGSGTFLYLHTGDSRVNLGVIHLHLAGGKSTASTSTAATIAKGTVAAAAAGAAGIGIYAWVTHQAYGIAAGKVYDATLGKVVTKAKRGIRRAFTRR